jgi:polysaccharide biosynthesis transport protein
MENHNLPDIVVSARQNLPSRNVNSIYDGDLEKKFSLRPYWNVLIKRMRWVIATFVTLVALAVIVSFVMTPVYRATSVLQITQDNPAASGLMGDRDPLAALFASDSQNRFYETQFMLLNSRAMGYRIMDTLDLMASPEYKDLMKAYPDKTEEEVRSKFVSYILKNLTVKPLKRSFLVEIAFTWEDKQVARQVLNVIAEEYMKFCMDTRRQSYQLIKNWLEGELQTLGSKVEESEKRVYAYGKEKDFLAIEDSKENVTVNKYVKLNLLVTKAQSERMIKEAQYKQIKEKGVDAPLITNNPLIQKLREETIAQEAKVSSLNKIFDQNYPQLVAEKGKLKEFNSRLHNEVKRVRSSLESDYEAARKAEDMLQEALVAQKGKVGDLQEKLVKHHILKRDMQTNEQLYQGLLARMKETSVASTMVASNVAVVVPAELPFKPYKPRKLFNVLIASILGLFGGVGLAFLADHLDDSIKSAAEMESSCHLPTLGVVPLHLFEKELTKEDLGLVTFYEPRAKVTEAIRQVRTAVMLSSSGNPPTGIMVTSPNPSEGKTSIATNLAVSLAQNGHKTVLLDADLRKPRGHKVFKQTSYPGLSNYLSGSASLSEILRPTEVPDLFFIAAGNIPPNPAELLASDVFQNLLTDLKRDFLHLVIDSPPIIEFADGRVISPTMDAVIMVLRFNSTTREAAHLAKDLLNQVGARTIGSVLNMATTDRLGNYSSYYYYKQYYYQSYYMEKGKGDKLIEK